LIRKITQPLSVALLSPLFESVPPRLYGGTERVIDLLCRGLSAAGANVTLFASEDSRAAADWGCRLIPVIDEALRLKSTPPEDPNVFNFRMLAKASEYAEEFDIIHNHHDYWMLPLCRMTSTPLVSTIHGRMDMSERADVFNAFADCFFVSISDSQRAPVPNLRWLRTVYHGMTFEHFEFKPNPGNYLAFLGRISPEKRPEWAIQIAKRSGVPLKIAAKIEGKAGQEYYDAYVKPHVDGRNIEYIGEVSEGEKASFLGNALALVFPIDWPEPFGLVMIESLACGTPVLARPCGAVPEILMDGVTGFCDLDIKTLARRVVDISSLDRRACRKWVEDRFSLERMTEEYIHVYREVINRCRSDRNRRDLLHPVERAINRDS
jgi:glycosyltransferase involved in cell wall biosynthesis